MVQRMATSPGGMTWQDPLADSPVGWADVEDVRFDHGRQVGWYIDQAAKPPRSRSLEPGVLIARGLVLDTTDDGVADYVIGIDNDAPPGDHHVWITNLATGKTDEQIGPPYGYPIEFSHPDPGSVHLMFLNGQPPEDFDRATVRFYAWTSVTRDGEVIASDYAPDTGWMTAAAR